MDMYGGVNSEVDDDLCEGNDQHQITSVLIWLFLCRSCWYFANHQIFVSIDSTKISTIVNVCTELKRYLKIENLNMNSLTRRLSKWHSGCTNINRELQFTHPYIFYMHSKHKSERKNVSKRVWISQSLYFRPIRDRYPENRSSRPWIKVGREADILKTIFSNKGTQGNFQRGGWMFSPTRSPWKS